MSERLLRYSMIIEWEPLGQVFVVTVPELPGCKTHGATYEEAVRQGQDAIESWLMVAEEDGDPIPSPRYYDLGDWQEEEAAEPALATTERS
jgi:predicted RNase H-like HicB family nuclease